MPTQELNEDAIDSQELQAQIDLSMSFAQNLVTSWVKPTHFTQHTKQRNLENELKEYMRRPPRLGVGAPIPEMQNFAQEATRLRSKLEGGKKRRRVEETAEMKQPQSESEEESRAGAIKKKVRADPFDVVTKKKKKSTEADRKNILALHPAAFKAMSRTQSDIAQEASLEAEGPTKELLGASEPSEAHEKKKRHHSGHDKEPQKQVRVPSAGVALPNIETTSNGVKSQQNTSSPKVLNAPTKPPALLAQPPPASPTTQPKVVDVSLTTTPVLSPGRFTSDPRFLKQPLLNLIGSPNGGESDEDVRKPEQYDLTPKRKRKRRKKRKKQNVEVAGTAKV